VQRQELRQATLARSKMERPASLYWQYAYTVPLNQTKIQLSPDP
jgi:hypothetical protein